jgi:Cytoskeletal-regulatory complex EF hand
LHLFLTIATVTRFSSLSLILCHYHCPIAEDDDANPWGDDKQDSSSSEWALQGHVALYKPQFDQIARDGLVSGAGAKSLLTATGLHTSKLRKIWELSDIDKDGHLDLQEFVIAMYLTEVSKLGDDLPPKLDPDMIPANKKR